MERIGGGVFSETTKTLQSREYNWKAQDPPPSLRPLGEYGKLLLEEILALTNSEVSSCSWQRGKHIMDTGIHISMG